MTSLAPATQVTDLHLATPTAAPAVAPLLPQWFSWMTTAVALAFAFVAGAATVWPLAVIALTIIAFPTVVEAWWAWSETRDERIATQRELAEIEALRVHA